MADPTPDLVAWLRGVLDEDEDELRTGWRLDEAEWTLPECGTRDALLADIEAKRAILALHHGDFPYNLDDGPGDFAWTEQCQACGQVTPCRTLRLLASANRDRPGYREEWKP